MIFNLKQLVNYFLTCIRKTVKNTVYVTILLYLWRYFTFHVCFRLIYFLLHIPAILIALSIEKEGWSINMTYMRVRGKQNGRTRQG